MSSCTCGHSHENEKNSKQKLVINIIGVVVFLISLFISFFPIKITLFVISYLLIGYDILYKAFKRNIKKGYV